MKNTCTECSGKLVKGAQFDYTYGGVRGATYADFKEPDGMYEMKATMPGNFKDMRTVITYRCTKCNRLYAYADEKVIASDPNQKANQRFIFVIFVVVGIGVLYALFS